MFHLFRLFKETLVSLGYEWRLLSGNGSLFHLTTKLTNKNNGGEVTATKPYTSNHASANKKLFNKMQRNASDVFSLKSTNIMRKSTHA